MKEVEFESLSVDFNFNMKKRDFLKCLSLGIAGALSTPTLFDKPLRNVGLGITNPSAKLYAVRNKATIKAYHTWKIDDFFIQN